MKNRCFSVLLSIVTLALLAFGLSSNQACADGGSARSSHSIGVDVGLFSDPYPDLWSISVGYNILDFVRLNAGYGNLSGTADGVSFSTTSVGGGVKLFIPGWNFSPFVGYEISSWSLSGAVSIGGTTLNANKTVGISYIPIGLDWQTDYGLHLALGYQISLSSVDGISIPGLPTVQAGFYFPASLGL